MTATTEAPTSTTTPAIEMAGRTAFVEGGRVLTTVTHSSDTLVFTAHTAGQGLTETEVVTLPITGEFVTVDLNGRALAGHWLGLATEHPSANAVEAFVLTTAGVVEAIMVPSSTIEARRIVTPNVQKAERGTALTALLVEARKHRQAETTYRNRLDRLVESAHEYAEDNELCGKFDEFMEENSLPPRQKSFDLAVEVTATVYLTREGRDADDAAESVSKEEIVAYLDSSNISISTTENY